MKRYILLSIICCMGSYTSYTQITFEKHYSISSVQYGYYALQTSDGGYIVCGSEHDASTNKNMFLIRTNQYGDTLWTKSYGGQYDDEAYSMTISSDGFILCGYKKVYSKGKDVYLVKTDFNGQEIWSKTFGGNFDDIAYSIDRTNDNGFIICGETSSYGNSSQVYLIRTNASGDTLWTKKFGEDAADAGYSVKKTNDNGFIICGEANGNQHGVLIIKTSSNGNVQWSKIVGVSTEDIGYSVDQTIDNGYIVCGKKYFTNNATTDIYLIRTNSDGDTLWTKTIGDSQENEIGKSIHQTSDYGFIICGTKTSEISDRDVYLLKTNSNGVEQWSRTFGSLNLDLGNSVNKTDDGGYIICGTYDIIGGPFDVFLIKTNNEGIVTSIKEKYEPTNIRLYPNPCNSMVFIELDRPFRKIEIVNSNGIIQKVILPNDNYRFHNTVKFDCTCFLPGIYLIKVETSFQAFIKKLIVIH